MPLPELSLMFILQVVLILGTCRLVGLVAKKMGQPQVVAEMIAGVLLGPSVFQQGAPAWHAWIFPAESKPILYCVSQLGLALYMFLVGLEFRTDLFQARWKSAASVSIAGMVTPFVLGAMIAAWLVRSTGVYFTERITSTEAMLFLGASLSITAFPMLSRIIVERKLSGTSLGTLVLAAGAIDDAVAWCLLATVLAIFDANFQIAVFAILGGFTYTVLMLTLGRWCWRFLGTSAERSQKVTGTQLAAALFIALAGASLTEYVGIHAVFGAFIAGCALPRGVFSREVARQVEPLVSVLLIPLFFTYSGLNTRLDMVTSFEMWIVAAIVLIAACLGKGAACWAAARWTGENNTTSLAVGTLMNARGMMELIILNIGLQRGLITPPLFSIMVVMAISTTLMATPIFEWVYGRRTREEQNEFKSFAG